MPLDVDDDAGEARGRMSMLRLVGLTSFMFASGLLLSTYGMITLALEAARLAPANATIVLPSFLALAGVSQLVCPLAGYLSDRHVSRWGKRRPFIAAGAGALALGLLVQWASRAGEFPGLRFDVYGNSPANQRARKAATAVYAVAFFISMIALNFAYTAATCLVPDKVPPSQTGMANGVATLSQVAGSCVGFLFYFVYDDLNMLYALYLTAVLFSAALTLICAGGDDAQQRGSQDRGERDDAETLMEKQPQRRAGRRDPRLEAPQPKAGFSWVALCDCYYVSPREPATRDFFFVLVSRTLYYTGGSAQAFLQYYVRDRLDVSSATSLDRWLTRLGFDPEDAARATCLLALSGYVSGALAALPAGALSDKLGRKPVVVFSCGCMGMAMLGLGFSSTATSMLAYGLLGGLGNGAYQAVDLALAVDTLPDHAESARFMGIWGVGAFVGVCLGPLIGGPLLYTFGQIGNPTPPRNSQPGYVALFLFGAVMLYASAAVLIRYVTKSR